MKLDKSNWKEYKLIDIITKKEENDRENAQARFDRFLKVDHMDAESLHIKRWSSQKEGEEINPTFYKIFRKGQILFPTRNPHLRRTVLASFDGICGEKTLTLEPKGDVVLPEFIPFLFHSENFYAHTTSAIIGSTNPHCRWRDVANYEFLLPPIDEQARLAELLLAMDEVIEKEKISLEKLEVLLKTIEYRYFSVEPSVALKKVIPKTINGGTPTTKNTGFYSNGTIPWITTKTLNEDYTYYGEKLITIQAVKNSAAKILPKDNILAGTRVGVGKFSINRVDISFSQDIHGLYVDKDVVDLEYLLFQLNSNVFQKKIAPLLRGTTIKGILKDDLLNLNIQLPEKIVQIEVAEVIKKTKASILQSNLKVSASQSLQKALINQIF